MQIVYPIIQCSTVEHPDKWTITKLHGIYDEGSKFPANLRKAHKLN